MTLPFVVRSVQPVLLELDREMEDAAASLGAGPFTVFRRIILPNLRPAILSGVGLGFARALGEFGSVVLISGNLPFKTEVASVFVFGQIESDRATTAAAGLGAAAGDLVRAAARDRRALGAEGRAMSSGSASRLGLRTIALGYLAALLVLPVGLVFYRTFEHGLAPAWDAVTTPEAQHAFWLTLVMVAIAVPANTIFGVGMALVLARGRVPGQVVPRARSSTCRSPSRRSSSAWR